MPERGRDVAAQAFLDLLKWFQVVLLQDAVFLRCKFLSLKLWTLPPFNHPLFDEFSKSLLHEAAHGQDPLYVQIAKIQPMIARVLQDQHQNTLITMNLNQQTTNTQFESLQTQLNQFCQSLQPIESFIRNLSQPEGLQLRTQLNLIDQNLVSTATVTSTSSAITAVRLSSDTSTTIDLSNRSEVIGQSMENEIIEQYHLDSGVTTVSRLWEEYDKGIISKIGVPRGPSIRELDCQFGSKWRKQESPRKAYARRRYIWEAILLASENLDLSPDIIAEKMEQWRCKHGHSLHKVNGMLLEVIHKRAPPLWGEKDQELLSYCIIGSIK
jgi:Transcriptional activator of glycolytic enzymes